MKRKMVSAITLALLITSMLMFAFNIQPVKALTEITIWSDGSIDPPDAPIERDGETYTLLSDIITDESFGIEIFRSGITLDGSGYTLQANFYGVSITVDSVTIKDLTVTGCAYGIGVGDCSNTALLENTITGNGVGIALRDGRQGGCTGSILRDNEMWDNTCNFMVTGNSLIDFVHDIDLSNTVDGRPIYYWVNREYEGVPSDAGYVALVNCSNIIVQDLSLSHNFQGILLMHTTESMVHGNELTNNTRGIDMLNSSFNCFSDNVITNNGYGIMASLDKQPFDSLNNSIFKNRLESNSYGLYLRQFCSGYIYENVFFKNEVGLFLKWSHFNLIYHNNFVNNTRQADFLGINNANWWDNGYPSGGNYWSDHNFTNFFKGEYQDENGCDGICDEYYWIGEQEYDLDLYPLMGTFQSYSAAGKGNVDVVTNSTLLSFSYSESEGCINIEVSGIEGYGFCTLCIPHTVMDVDSVSVIIDGGLTEVLNYDSQVFDNGTHRWIYFAYEHSTHEIVIVPEFPSFLIIPLFMIATLLAVTFYRSKSIGIR